MLPIDPVSGDPFIPLVVPVAASAGTALGVFLRGMFAPTSRLMGPIVVHGPRSGPARVALTFDDGPAEGTGAVLDSLKASNCRATFFVIGRNVERRPDLVRRAAAEGHLIGNHSFDHARQGIWRRSWYWEDQFRRTSDAIARTGGPERCGFFRPPMGFKSWRMVKSAEECGYTMVTWSLRGMDGVPKNTEEILERVLPRAKAGDIIALHDGAEPGRARDVSATVRAIPELVRELRKKGLEPVRLDELLGDSGATDAARGARACTKAPAALRAS